MKQTEQILHTNLEFLPLKSYANIVEANALRIDWNEVVPKDKLNYIIGNPPFVGKKEQTKEQKNELLQLFNKNTKGIGNIDYVTGWYIKASKYIKYTNICCAFVSTNSITQGEQVSIIWKELLKDGLSINFAYRTFRWDSEASLKAHVHCVIIGFSYNKIDKYIYNNGKKTKATNISPYLIDAPTIFIESSKKPISDVSPMNYGSMPIDNGYLILSEEEKNILIKENGNNSKFIKKYIGGEELINNKVRYCIWLDRINPIEAKNSKFIMERIKLTKDFRERSKRPQTLKAAENPYLFGEIRQPDTDMLVIPKVSSETRKYIPISFVTSDIIVNGSALIIPNADLFMFGILTSNVHNSWMRTVAGRLGMSYQYSASIVYNTFPFPTPTEEQKAKIEKTANGILEARALYPDCSLADLYDELTMPQELRKAHQENDRAVMEAYGFPVKNSFTESMCVAELMKMYQNLTEKNNT